MGEIITAMEQYCEVVIGQGHPGARAQRGLGATRSTRLGEASTLSRRRPPKLAGMDAGPAGDDRGQWA